MPIGTTTLDVFNDSGLTTTFGSNKTLIHNTDLSDNPQTFVFYIGSLGSTGLGATDRVFYATSNPGVDDIVVSVVDSLPEWQASHTYSLGQSVEPTVGNGKRYTCTTVGTSGTSEPTWPTGAVGSVVTDGSVVWTLVGASHQTTEIKLSSTSDFSGSVAGASLSLGTSITSGVSNAKAVHVQVTNAVTTASNNTGTPEISLAINTISEEPA